jgi:hypothetical protein
MVSLAKPTLIERLVQIGSSLGFDVVTEVEASESAWVDVVWFDKRLPLAALSSAKPKMRYAPVLPVLRSKSSCAPDSTQSM